MGRRGGNAFKRNDAIRALQSARDGGIDPARWRSSSLWMVLSPSASLATGRRRQRSQARAAAGNGTTRSRN